MPNSFTLIKITNQISILCRPRGPASDHWQVPVLLNRYVPVRSYMHDATRTIPGIVDLVRVRTGTPYPDNIYVCILIGIMSDQPYYTGICIYYNIMQNLNCQYWCKISA